MSHAENLSYRGGGRVHGTGSEGLGSGQDPEVARSPERPSASSPASGSRPTGIDMPRSGRTNQTDSAARDGLADAKAAVRARVLTRRRERSAEERAAAGRQLRDLLLGLPEMQMAAAVAA